MREVSERAMGVGKGAVKSFDVSCSCVGGVETSCCLLNTLLKGCGETRMTLPKKYGVKDEPVSRRLGKFHTLKTSMSVRCNGVITRTRRLGKARLCFSIIAMNTAVGMVVTTTVTSNLAVVRGMTGRPRIMSMTGFLGDVKTGVHNTKASIVGVHKIGSLRGTRCSVVPSRVRTKAFVFTTTTAHKSIAMLGIVPGRLSTAVSGLMSVKYRIRRFSSTIHMITGKHLADARIGALPCPKCPASVRPRVKIILTLTGKADAVARDVFRGHFGCLSRLTHVNTGIGIRNGSTAVRNIRGFATTEIDTPSLHTKTTLYVTKLTARKVAVMSSVICVREKCRHFRRGLEDLNKVVRGISDRGRVRGFGLGINWARIAICGGLQPTTDQCERGPGGCSIEACTNIKAGILVPIFDLCIEDCNMVNSRTN